MKTQRILIVSPVFNEWTSVHKLLEEIDSLELNKQVGILLVNDGSTLRIGNFSAIPKPFVRSLVNASELWMNNPSSILKLKLPFILILAVSVSNRILESYRR